MKITVETLVQASAEETWGAWVTPESIIQWNFASDDWHCPRASVDLRPGGQMNSRMEAKDGSMGFDFEAEFTTVSPPNLIEYSLVDGRGVTVEFIPFGGATRVVETFDAEDENSAELQRQGWQSILNQFKRFVENR
ncbi:MAG: SRPBCC family protein [Puniceicoccaceae bacterium]